MFLLMLQGASELIKRLAFLRGLIPDPLAHGQTEKDSPAVISPDDASEAH
jgi:TRAP-type mannitol/chloroaromatic compound transport system permease small subunit